MSDEVETRIQRVSRSASLGGTLRAEAPTRSHGGVSRGGPRKPQTISLPRLSLSLDAPEPAANHEYHVTGSIGEGGMGSVLVAQQHSLDREVAIKITKPEAAEHHRTALLHEGQVMGRLEHPAIVPVHALGVADDGRPVLVMKRVHGTEWSTLLSDPDHPAWSGWGGDSEDRLLGHLNILQRVADALRYAHSKGVTHCDVKPANVLIGEYGDAYLADWGIARSENSVSDLICGTPTFMAPEMVEGSALTRRTDVFLLGAVLHLLLTRRPRHDATTVEGAMRAAWLAEAFEYGPEVPEELGAIANRACHRDPESRYASVADFQEALREFARHRDSARLTDEARARFRQSLTHDVSQPELQRIHELELAAARFGLEQALALWPANDVARRALDELEACADEERSRVTALERLAKQNDPSVSSSVRAGLLAAQAVIGIAAGVILSVFRPPLPAEVLVGVPVACLVVGAATVSILRDRMWTTQFNRRTLLLLAAMLIVMTVHRVSSCFIADQGLAEVLTGDAFLIATAMLIGSFTLLPWLAWVGLLAISVGTATAFWPEQAVPLQGLLIAGSTALAAVFSWGERAPTVRL